MYAINGAALGQAKFTLAPTAAAQIREKTRPTVVQTVEAPAVIPPEIAAEMRRLAAERAAAASGAGQGLPTWAWALIGVGGAAALFGAFVFLRRRRAAKEG